MSDDPTPSTEATRALREVERRRGQARTSQQESRWVGVAFGVAIFAELAAPDFFGEKVRPWISLVVNALLVVYAVMLRTRRGSSLLGRPTRVRREELSPRFVLWARLALAAVLLVGYFGAFYLDGELFPYAGTALGVLLGGLLIVFGRRLQQALNSLAVRGNGGGLDGADGLAHGSR